MSSLDPSTLHASLRPFYTQTLSQIPQAHHPALRDLTLFFNTLVSSPTTHNIADYIASHPIEIGILLLSLLILTNPLAIAGFTGRGVAAHSSAAAWQSTMGGHVASGSLFSVLQSIGAQHAIAIPATAGVALAAVIAKLGAEEILKETAKTAAEELGKCDWKQMSEIMVNGAVQGWEKVGGEAAARIALERAAEELQGLDAGKLYQNAVNMAAQGYEGMGGDETVKVVAEGTVVAGMVVRDWAAQGYEGMGGDETVKVVAEGTVVAGMVVRDWAVGTFGGWF